MTQARRLYAYLAYCGETLIGGFHKSSLVIGLFSGVLTMVILAVLTRP